MLARAQGCLLGQLAGDSLGSLVEFSHAEKIAASYPDGVRELANGGVWGTLAGQPTDDSEMALMLARSLVKEGTYKSKAVREAYLHWLRSGPFDMGNTISMSLTGRANPDSQANGALMRVSPLGIFGASRDLQRVAEWAMTDAFLTHVHPVCQQANALFVMAIAQAIKTGPTPQNLFRAMETWSRKINAEPSITRAMEASRTSQPRDFSRHQGWVLIAFQNALYQLLHAETLEEGVVDTVMRGGDTDTNAAICGALLGAVHGREQIPRQWEEAVLNCRPSAMDKQVFRPRPKEFWPVDALELAKQLVFGGGEGG
jgi:ADP-ribosyl-[dinitrogen reductase] hydrolase